MKTEHKSFAEWREEEMIKQAAGERMTARYNASLAAIDPLYHRPEEIDRAILYVYCRNKPYNGWILRLNSAGVR